MKKLVVRKDLPCMACLSCVRACSEAFYKVFDQAKSCIQIVEKNGAVKVNTCVQCGKCMRTCKNGAITQNPKTGVYMINKKLCTGCGECVKKCPKKAITLTVRKHPRDANAKVGTTPVGAAVPKA